MRPLFSNTLLWFFALVFTIASAAYQRATGPTYPISGKAEINDTVFNYDIKRTHGGKSDHPVSIVIPNNDNITGFIVWKRYKLNEDLHKIPMKKSGDTLRAYLPHQPPAGKLEYQAVLEAGDEKIYLPKEKPAVIRFKGAVPMGALIPHVILMFTGLLFSMRTALTAIFGRQKYELQSSRRIFFLLLSLSISIIAGLAFFSGVFGNVLLKAASGIVFAVTISVLFELLFGSKMKPLAWITLGLIIVGGLIFGPIVQKYAFGAYWTGWPFGEDLTDNKTAVMAIAWIIALWRITRKNASNKSRWWIVAAMVVTFAVYLIPHSMRGSELDYSKLPADSLEVSEKTAADST